MRMVVQILCGIVQIFCQPVLRALNISLWKVPICPDNVNNCSARNLVMSRDSLPSSSEQDTLSAWYSSACLDGNGRD